MTGHNPPDSPRQHDSQPDEQRVPGRWLLMVLLLWLGLFSIRLVGPPNFTDKDQERPASYMMDVALNGNWIVQRDFAGEITSKPPLYTWLGALVMVTVGHMHAIVLYLPTALATLGIALLVLRAGTQHWGAAAGLLGTVFYLANSGVWKQIALARTDAVFSFAVTWTAWEAYRAWSRGRGWTRFWLAATVATLAKGPLGLLLGGVGLLAVWWERKAGDEGSATFHWRRFAFPGLALWLLISAGWFALSVWDQGDDVIDKMIRRELVGHLAGGETSPGDVKPPPLASVHKPLLYFISRFAPWSLLTLVGLWMVWKRPDVEDRSRRFERFLLCWFVGGLTVFSVAGHARGDLIFPLIPPGALLAGRLVARWLEARPRWRPATVALVVGAASLAGAAGKYVIAQQRDERSLQTLALRELALELKEKHPGLPLVHLDAPFTLQMYLNTLVPVLSPAEAAQLLDGDAAAWLAVERLDELRALLRHPGSVHVLREIKLEGVPPLHLVSNRRDFDTSQRSAMRFGALQVNFEGMVTKERTGRALRFAATATSGRVTVRHDGRPRPVTTTIVIESTPDGVVRQERVLKPGEIWEVSY